MNTTGTEGVKDWLLELRAAIIDAELTEERLDTLRSRAESARTASISGLPHAAGKTVDWIGVIVAEAQQEFDAFAAWCKTAEARAEGIQIMQEAEKIWAELEAEIAAGKYSLSIAGME